MARPIVFGEITGIKEGRWFSDRKEMMESSFHRRHKINITNIEDHRRRHGYN